MNAAREIGYILKWTAMSGVLIYGLTVFSLKIHRSDGEVKAYEQCMELKGVPVFAEWTGNMTGCLWPNGGGK